MKVVISGITSMLGSATAQSCLNKGWQVVGLARKDSAHLCNIPVHCDIEIVDCNLEDLSRIDSERFGPCDIFYHFAWAYSDKRGRMNSVYQQKNIQYTLDAVQLANRLHCKKFVGAGSQAEYGWHTQPKTAPDSVASPVIPYGICKYAAGKLGSVLAESMNMDFFWVRVFSVYGENDMPDTMIASTIAKLKKGDHCSFTLGTHLWDYLYCDDAAEAFVLIGEKAKGNKVYCLGSGEAIPLKAYIEQIRDMVAPNAELGFGEIIYPSQGGMSMCADISEIFKDTGWMPKTTFNQGISKVVTAREK